MSNKLKITTEIEEYECFDAPGSYSGHVRIGVLNDVPEGMTPDEEYDATMRVMTLLSRLEVKARLHADCDEHDCNDALLDGPHVSRTWFAQRNDVIDPRGGLKGCVLELSTDNVSELKTWERMLKSWLREMTDPQYRAKERERRASRPQAA